MPRRLLVLMLGLLLLSGAAAAQISEEPAQESGPETTVLDIQLLGDERAHWTIEHRYRLDDNASQTAFADLEADIADQETVYVDRFAARMSAAAATASNSTDREMAIGNVTVETERRSIPRVYGIVRYRFTWTGFAVFDPTTDQITAGDAIHGIFLDEASVLRIRWSRNYDLSTHHPQADEMSDTSLVWRGPREFTPSEPSIVLEPRPATEAIPGWVVWFLGGLSLVILGAIAWRYRSVIGGEWPGGTASTSESAVDKELLSNEEQVLQVITENGGRMKQQEIVEQLGWTDAKTSQVVSNLREDDAIESFRLGRENVLRVPEEDDEELP